MVEKIKYRWDFIGLSTDTKPTPATNDRVANGSTFYCSDSSKLYVWYKDQWYEKTVSGGGGGTTNFNALSNRPKYNGTVMTGDTDIPEVKTYTAGSNVSISSGNVISATDTTYSDFTGTDGTAAGAAGLVPAPATTDAGKFLKADGTWDTAGGGGGPTVVQTIGSSTTDVMSQDATTKMVYYLAPNGACYAMNLRFSSGIDTNSGLNAIAIGGGTFARGDSSISIGQGAANYASGPEGVTIGYASKTNQNIHATALGTHAKVNNNHSVALGGYAETSRIGEVNIGAGTSGEGYDSTNYRVLGGVHDGQLAQDAVTVSQVNATIDAINTALSTNIPHIGAAS